MSTQDRKYIVNLTKQLVGEQVIDGIKEYAVGPDTVLFMINPVLAPKLAKMRAETLGRICAYGIEYPCVDPDSGFHFQTSILEAHLDNLDLDGKSGRNLLIEIATSVIVAIVFDIIHQAEYEELDRRTDEMLRNRI